MKPPLVTQVLCRLADRAGVEILLEPRFGRAGQIRLGGGRYSYFLNGSLDLNPVGSSDIAIAKDWCAWFMSSLGYPVIEGEPFYSARFCKELKSKRNVDAAWEYAKRLGLPVVVKPNSRSQGAGVCKVHNRREFNRAARGVFWRDRVMLVQRFVDGHDYRLVVPDGEVISAYERLPLTVIGNGRSTIRQLLVAKQRRFVREDRDTVIDMEDPRIPMHLARRKLTLDSVLSRDTVTTLLDNRNLSTGGDAVDVTDQLHAGFVELAVRITRDMGLRFCGVDLMVDGDIAAAPAEGTYWVIEINAAPGLDHYAASGDRQEAIVDALYLKVLEAISAWIPPDSSRPGSSNGRRPAPGGRRRAAGAVRGTAASRLR